MRGGIWGAVGGADKSTHTKQYRFDNQHVNKGRKLDSPYPFKPMPLKTFLKK